jgi:hypothetical protein
MDGWMDGWMDVWMCPPQYVCYLHFLQSKQYNMCLISEHVYISVCTMSAFSFFLSFLSLFVCLFVSLII